ENNQLGNLILGTSSLKLEYLSVFYSDHIDPNLRKIRDVVSTCYFEKISKYNLKGNLVKVYPNLKKASLGEGLSTAILMKRIEGQHIFPSDGNYYLRGHGPELLDFSLIENQEASVPNFRKHKSKPVFLRYYIDGSLKSVYSSIDEASNQTFCSKSKINLSIRTRSFVDDYLWVQLYEGSLVDLEVKKESYAIH
nr:hypothetical protein [Chitinophagaceae bacterium]